MANGPTPGSRVRGIAVSGALLVSPALVQAYQPQNGRRAEGGPQRAFLSVETQIAPSLVLYPAGSRSGLPPEMAGFLGAHSDRWEVRWDTRSDRPHLIQGVGVPMPPGRGNRFTLAEADETCNLPFSLAAFKGQTVRIQFRTTTDFSLPTTFRIDDLTLN